MNVFNRILMIVLILLGLAAAIALALFNVAALDVIRIYVDALQQALFVDQSYMIYLGALGVWALLMVILLVLELHHPRYKTVRIKTRGGGKARLGIDSVAQSLEYRIDELAGVRKVHPKIVSRGRDAAVTIGLDTSPSVNVPVLTDQIIELCHDIVEGQLGVKIRGKVVVNVKHEPYPRGTMPPTGPLGETAIATRPTLAESRRARPAEASRPAPKAVHPAPGPVVSEPEPILDLGAYLDEGKDQEPVDADSPVEPQ
jgi:hypothetical protein